MSRVVVIGSVNMDVVTTVDHHPLPGETVHGEGTTFISGGKGANQAVAAARQGSRAIMIGAIGTDVFSDVLLSEIMGHGVNVEYVVRKPGASGVAFINVDARGENTIVLSSGANAQLSPADVRKSAHVFDDADVLLLQNEIPWETNAAAIHEARTRGVSVWLNPAPAMRLSREQLRSIDVLILNETELARMTGQATMDGQVDMDALSELVSAGVSEVIVTLGVRGCHYISKGPANFHIPAFPVHALDTTAAGDAFIGSYAAIATAGWTTQEALTFASAAAAITVTRRGAQASIPSREEVEVFLREHQTL